MTGTEKRRVVVTGMGMLSALGADVASSWQGIKEGKSGIKTIEHFDTEGFSTRFAGMVPDFSCEPQHLLAKNQFSSRIAKGIQYFLSHLIRRHLAQP